MHIQIVCHPDVIYRLRDLSPFTLAVSLIDAEKVGRDQITVVPHAWYVVIP